MPIKAGAAARTSRDLLGIVVTCKGGLKLLGKALAGVANLAGRTVDASAARAVLAARAVFVVHAMAEEDDRVVISIAGERR